jgi:hypothetical protein
MQNIINPKPFSRPSPPKMQPAPQGPKTFLLFLLICGILGLFAYWKESDFLIFDKEKNPVPSPKREDELEKRKERLRNA